jgi:hypothetical protein
MEASSLPSGATVRRARNATTSMTRPSSALSTIAITRAGRVDQGPPRLIWSGQPNTGTTNR